MLSGLLSQLTIPTEALCCTATDCQKHLCALQAYYSDLVSCLHVAANKVVPNVKVNYHKHWWKEELDRLKQRMYRGHDNVAAVWVPSWRCNINSYRTRVKLKYKNAVKLAAQNADACLNDKLLNYVF